jgi:hypothetical protein
MYRRSPSPRTAPLRAAILVLIAVCAIVFGVAVALGAARNGPGDDAAETAFRNDPSCAREAAESAESVRGACRIVPAVVESAAEFKRGTVRTRSVDDVVVLRLGDGSRLRLHLSGADGAAFVAHVANGTDARAQFFRSTLARIVAGGFSAETKAAPDVVAAANRQSPWVAAGLIVFGLICALVAWRVARTANPNRRYASGNRSTTS